MVDLVNIDAFLARFTSSSGASLVGKKMIAKTLIRQSPCAEDAPDVPRFKIGTVEAVDDDDDDDVRIWVDFDEPYGAVLCDPSELELA